MDLTSPKSSLMPTLSVTSQTHVADVSTPSTELGSKTYDLIIVGFGLSGVCAAIAAAERQSSVLIVDRDHGGGTSILSGGVVYAGGGTPYQKAAGIEDTPENMYNYLKLEVGDAVSEGVLKRFCDGSVEMMEWLVKYGAKFEGSLCPWKTAYPADKHYMYYSGNEKAWPYREHAKPAARGHRFHQPGVDSGSGLWRALCESARKLGVQFQPLSQVEKLISADGRITGVEVRVMAQDHVNFAKHRKLKVRAKKYRLVAPALVETWQAKASAIWEKAAVSQKLSANSVILAAGGFAFNKEWREKFVPAYRGVAPLGSGNDIGLGIQLGLSIGGSTSHMDRFTAWRFLAPPSPLLGGVTMGADGTRIGAEDLYGATFTDLLIHKHEGKGYLILDSEQWANAKAKVKEEADYPIRISPLWQLYWAHVRGNSLEALALKLGIPESRFMETIGAYNDGQASGIGDPSHKSSEYCHLIKKAPFYSIDISVQTKGVFFVPGLTLGGLRVDGDSGMVLTQTGGAIPGLYAVGRNAVGICSTGYVSGLSLADCVFSGRRAGEHSALGIDAAPKAAER